MKIKVGINGCGRIGKLLIRLLTESDVFELVAVNDPIPTETLYNLLKYDSIHGKNIQIQGFTEDTIIINNKKIVIFHEDKPKDIPWELYNIACVLEASGKFKTKQKLEKHLSKTVKKVILCQPAEDLIDKTIVIGVNEEQLKPKDAIISNASCTTNCLAPILKIIDNYFGIEKVFFNTVHPYTNNQSLHDGAHKDPRRARAALCNIIPTTSSAVLPLQLLFPLVKNKINGFATRVPVPIGSYVEIIACVKNKLTVPIINNIFKSAADSSYRGIIEYSQDYLVSTDIIGNSHSAIFDSLCTKVIDENFIQILAWYDNETAYSHRIIDLMNLIFKKSNYDENV